MAKVKRQLEISPIGTIEYAWLDKPQPPFKGKEEDAKFSITLSFDPADADAEKWMAGIASKTKFPGRPWKLDGESGNIFVKFKSTFPAKLVDSKNQPLPEGKSPSRGSRVRVAYVVNEYPGFGGGINLYLHGVQVIEFKDYHKEIEFPVENEGYVGNPEPEGPSKDGDSLPF